MFAVQRWISVGRAAWLAALLCVAATVAGACTVADSISTDRAALEALYEATDGPNWYDSDKPSTPPNPTTPRPREVEDMPRRAP